MNALTLFGLVAVTAMLVFYVLEERAPAFVLLFAAACALSSVYGFLQGAWPFGIVEAVWGGVAIRRWRTRMPVRELVEERPIACDMAALATEERRRYDVLRSRVTGSVRRVTSTATSFRLELDHSVPSPEIAEWMALERRCCPFLTIALLLPPDGTRWVELGGSAAIKMFLTGEFPAIVSLPSRDPY